MRTFPFVLLLMASMAFVLVGCSDNSNSVLTPGEESIAASGSSSSLSKGGPGIHSATGNADIFYGGKSCTFAFTARKYADGSCDGEYQIYTHYQDPDWGKWHGKVTSLEVYDGNTAVIGGVETKSGFPGYYDAFVVQDNGEGNKDVTDMYTTTVFWNESLEYAQQVWAMPPNLVIEEIVKEQISMGYNVTASDIFIPIRMGNIAVR